MFNFGAYLTPEQAKKQDDELDGGRRESLSYYQKLAKNNARCEVCETEPVWKLVDTGLCFGCTTGESDASDDYELI